jgi:gluconolactonase
MSFRTSDFKIVAKGLQYPEGPVYQSDGSVLVVEIGGKKLTQILPDGTQHTVALLAKTATDPSGPNGAAIGPDGAVYVCNDGGLEFVQVGVVSVPAYMPPGYTGGSIQRVTDSGFSELYGNSTGNSLRSPDDLVFDRAGNFWFTDWGKTTPTTRDITGVYYAHSDGSGAKMLIPNRQAPNGIALSPDDSRLYVAETYARWIVYWELASPGTIKPNPKTLDGSYLLTAEVPGQGTLDSMAVDEEGNVYVATMLPQGPRPDVPGGITVISPGGRILAFIELNVDGQAEPLPSNICFGGPDRRTAFITLAGTGRLVSCEMKIPGKKLHFNR